MFAADPDPHRITELTRRDIIDRLSLGSTHWSGRLSEVEFLNRVYDLDQLPSTDRRYSSAAGDIQQHRINNYDWDDNWVFHDSRFGVFRGSDEQFLGFLAEMVHPAVVPSSDEAGATVDWINDLLRPDGIQLVVVSSTSGRPIYAGRR